MLELIFGALSKTETVIRLAFFLLCKKLNIIFFKNSIYSICKLRNLMLNARNLVVAIVTSIVSILILKTERSSAQSGLDFRQITNIPGFNINNQPMHNAWAGGIWIPMFMEIELNFDGLEDLVVFNRADFTHQTFIKVPVNGSFEYRYAPEYENRLPKMYNWMFTVDYDNGGKKDLFTIYSGLISVYKNVSTNGVLEFNLITDFLRAEYISGVTNLYISQADLPAIADIDGDGDIDILGITNADGWINYFKNMSMERYGVPDSLDYQLTDNCWGKIHESASGNTIVLNNMLPNCNIIDPTLFTNTNDLPEGVNHVQSTLTAVNFNKDSLMDLFIGHVDFNNVSLMVNGGTKHVAFGAAKVDFWPNYTTSVNVNSFAAAYQIDFNNDGKKDLVFAPYETYYSVKNGQIAAYQNVGTTTDSFIYLQNNFLEESILGNGSYSVPVAIDLNNDGLKDLLVSTVNQDLISTLHYYQNMGTVNAPAFKLVDTNYLNIQAFGLFRVVPAVGDLNGDGKADLLLGTRPGDLICYYNTSVGLGTPATFALQSTNWKGINVFRNAAPEIVDIDRDGLNDLIIGNRDINMYYYRNIGTNTNPTFQLITDRFLKVDVSQLWNTSFAIPRIADFNNNGNYDLVVGSEQGKLYFYPDFENRLNDSILPATHVIFDSIAQVGVHKILGTHIAPCIFDFDGDYFPDLILGSYNGGMKLFKNHSTTFTNVGLLDKNFEIAAFPNPTKNTVTVRFNTDVKPHFTLFDLRGRALLKVSTTDYSASHLIDLQQFAEGLYLLEVQIGSQKQVIKLVKQ